MSDRWATFDCYGTLIDWFGGVKTAMAALWPSAPIDDLMDTYHRLAYDDRVTSDRGEGARSLLGLVADEHGLTIPAGRENALNESVPDWPAFPEVPAALKEVQARGWKMAILTNVDPAGLISSLPKLGISWDLLVTPNEAGSPQARSRPLGVLLPAERGLTRAAGARLRELVSRPSLYIT
jgi:2-haloacid dehalogenase